MLDGTDQVFYADGLGPFPSSPTRHWARHFVHPVEVTTFSVALEYRTERGSGYTFDLEVEQRAPVLKKYRLRVDANGAVSLWRTVAGVPTQVASSGNNTIPTNQKRWIRFAVQPDGSGHPRLRARVWATSAASCCSARRATSLGGPPNCCTQTWARPRRAATPACLSIRPACRTWPGSPPTCRPKSRMRPCLASRV